MTLKINKTHLTATIVLFSIEALIAVFLKTGFIRHTFGDFLVVILMYCFFKSVFEINSLKLAISVLLFAFFIEFIQLANILGAFNLQNNYLATLLLGSTFHISDLVAYILGILTILIADNKFNKLCIL